MMEQDFVLESKEEEESEKDILEIIEELPEDPPYQSYNNNNNNNNTVVQEHDDDNQEQKETDGSLAVAAAAPRPSEFSLSSIKFSMIGDALHGSAVNLGSATASLFQEAQSKIALKLPSPNNGEVNNSNHNNASTNRSLLSRLGGGGSDHYSMHSTSSRSSKVQFGELECRASRLRYTQEDIFKIVDDPEQFDELRNALRSLGAITNTVLKQKLHWYVKNSKRERERQQQEQLEREQQLLALQQQQQQQWAAAAERQRDLGPITPPTETKVLDSDKVLQSAVESMRKMTEKDPSPKSVRGIFVPAS